MSRFPALIVPGYTPMAAVAPIRLHPLARRRVHIALDIARREAVPFLLFSGGAVRPAGTPFVEADEMAAEAIRQGWPEDRILRERAARHTPTNLRNCGRILLDRGWSEALVVTTFGQAVYLGWPRFSGFHARCVRELGYEVGDLAPLGYARIGFRPSEDVRREGPDPLDR